MAIKKMCSKCGKYINVGTYRCPECEVKYQEYRKNNRKETDRRYDKERDSKYVKFYKTKEWRMVRDKVLSRDYGLCKLCYKDMRITHAVTVHHIEEVKEDWDKRLNENNLICLCNSCHNQVHGIYKTKGVQVLKRELKGLTEP